MLSRTCQSAWSLSSSNVFRASSTASTSRLCMTPTIPMSSRSLSISAHALSSSKNQKGDDHEEASPFSRPGPPPLPPKEQREFERLVKEKSNALQFNASSSAKAGEPDALHPDARRVPTPDFDGDTNPSTGEVGGPKKDPLAWQREWTYGGRATDF